MDEGDGLIESVIPLQIVARNLAVALGCGVDRPRKLTRSVAVE
jgi:glucosamine--fructose-6-phosphate aminotransferase (isomerizing)